MMAILLSSLLVEVASASYNAEQPCSYNRPDYSVEWGYDPETDRVIFSLRAKTDHEGFLTGIAFGNKVRLHALPPTQPIKIITDAFLMIDFTLAISRVVSASPIRLQDKMDFEGIVVWLRHRLVDLMTSIRRHHDQPLFSCHPPRIGYCRN